ncbi:MAG: imidazolonepropionase [Azospirillaceae bacterium]
MAAGSGFGLIEDGALAIEAGRVAWVGQSRDLPERYRGLPVDDLAGCVVTPALIDCHTHLVFGGHRADEFEQRLAGASYEEIARAGGGIRSTVASTRAASVDDLVAAALPRLDALLADGIGTVEIKSGYGLDLETERRMLQAARRLAALRPVDVVSTFLGAHALPPEFVGRPDDYIAFVCAEALPTLAGEGLVDAVDGFCETIGFSPAQIERVFETATRLGLPVKLHAEQLSNQGGAALACRYQALSADHLEFLDQAGVDAMAASGTVAVLLPGAFYFLRDTTLPPVEALRAAGVPIAVATDCNPGSSPLLSPLLAMQFACTLFRLTPAEALAGMTGNAARALGLTAPAGRLEPGAPADLAVWDVRHPNELAYWIGQRPLKRRIWRGRDG